MPSDIARLAEIRAAVRENRLTDPGAVTRADYDRFIAEGLMWVAEDRGRIAGFSASDPNDGSIWALFVDPEHEGRGIGHELFERALRDLSDRGHRTAKLTTDPGTRAERFYRARGWIDAGLNSDGELRFLRELDAPNG